MYEDWKRLGIVELQGIFDNRTSDAKSLKQLRRVLKDRRVKAAKALLEQVEKQLAEIKNAQASSPTATARSVEYRATLLGEDSGATSAHPSRSTARPTNSGEAEPESSPKQPKADPRDLRPESTQQPDDQERPTKFSKIRPPGTSGLPDAWQRPLKRDLVLPVAANGELPDRFHAALQALITEIKRSGSGQRRFELENGRRADSSGPMRLYRFPFTEEADLFEDARVDLVAFSKRYESTLVSISPGQLLVGTNDDLGEIIARATLIIDDTALLSALEAF